MKLFTFATSPYARKTRIVLDYKGISYEALERCYSLDRKEDLRDASIRAEVPVLVLDDGRTIVDSTIICEYLEEVYPQPATFPADAFQRAGMRRIEDLCDRTFDAIGFGYFLGVLRKEAPEAEAIKQAARASVKHCSASWNASWSWAASIFVAHSAWPTLPRFVMFLSPAQWKSVLMPSLDWQRGATGCAAYRL